MTRVVVGSRTVLSTLVSISNDKTKKKGWTVNWKLKGIYFTNKKFLVGEGESRLIVVENRTKNS